MHRIFAESIPLTEYALSVLTSPTDHNMYAAGTISRIFQRAIDLWPNEIYDVFHYSDKLYLTVIENIDKDVVYMTLLDSLTDEKEYFTELMWYIFLALVKTSNEKNPSNQINFEHPPRKCFLSKDYYAKLPTFGNSNCKILNAINVLKQYFSLKKKDIEDFCEYVLEFIIKQAKSDHIQTVFHYQYFDLAKEIGHNEELQEISINLIKQAAKLPENAPPSSISLRSPLVISALSYLEVCATHLGEKNLKPLVVSMIDDRNTQFGLLSTVKIIKAATSSYTELEWFRHFKDLMGRLIACAWNKYHIDQPLIVSILIDISLLLSVDESSNPSYAINLKEWKRADFILSAVVEQSEKFDFDLVFPESSYDIIELNELRWGPPF